MPATFLILILLSSIADWIQIFLTSKCRVRPRPLRLAIAFAAFESVYNSGTTVGFQPMSTKRDSIPISSAAVLLAAYNSASAELSATVAWRFDHDFSKAPADKTTPPLTLRRLSLQPAQSLSE